MAPKILAALLGVLAMTVTLFGCGSSGGSSGGSPPVSNDRGGEVATPPDIAGTWQGTYTDEDAEGGPERMTLSLEQDGEELTGHANFAFGGGSGNLRPLQGAASPSRDFDLAFEGADGVPPADFEGSVEGDDSISGTMVQSGDRYDFDLERQDLSSPEGFAEAAVQSMHDRNYLWLAEHADVEWRETADTPSTEGLAEDTAEAFARETDDDYEAPLPSGVGVDLVGESVVAYESGPTTELDAEYETSDGAVGYVNVDLIEAGTASAGYGYRIRSITLEYEVDGEGNQLTLGAGNY